MASTASAPKSIALFGATGTIGTAALHALRAAGHDVICILRPDTAAKHDSAIGFDFGGADAAAGLAAVLPKVDAVVSCLASRTGGPADAWAIDYQAHADILAAAKAKGIGQFVLLSAICVQKPLLAFQQAKLAFEQELQASGLTYSIVRPTAFFKSLSGQVKRVQDGRGFLVFGDGRGTACKPISDRDLGRYIVLCLNDPDLQNRVLPIGGPGPAVTARRCGEMLFELTGQPRKFKSVPLRMMDMIVGVSGGLGRVIPSLAAKADFARIGRYYATESMLVWDGQAYNANATPEFGADTLFEHYRALIVGDVTADLGDHAVF